jgi:IclR family transcriptional regulator, acetate operon repressor
MKTFRLMGLLFHFAEHYWPASRYGTCVNRSDNLAALSDETGAPLTAAGQSGVAGSGSNGRLNTLQTVKRSLQVLDLLASQPGESWKLTDLSRETKIHKSTLSRLLLTLNEARYVTKDAEQLTYRLGPSAFALGGAASMLLKEITGPVLRRLTAHTGETALLHVLRGQKSLCIDKVESPHPVRVTYDIGRHGPLHAGTSGKTLLAFMDPEEFELMLPSLALTKYTERTITDAEALRREMSLIRSRGCSISHGELDEGVCSVGAPIWNSVGTLEAGISLVGPALRWTEERWESYIRETIAAAEEVSRELGNARS